jgi:hypothetical protein
MNKHLLNMHPRANTHTYNRILYSTITGKKMKLSLCLTN